MTTTVEINIDNPTQLESVLAFIEKLGLKAMVSKNGHTISEMDEDDYLFNNKKNKERLLTAIDNAEKGKNLVEVDLDEFVKKYTN